MPAFDMVVVGAGGGPDELNLSAYLIKPCEANWEDGIVALEAGSGVGALSQILRSNRHIFADRATSATLGKTYSASQVYSFVRCFLITHAHLDHVASLVLSAGALEGPRKRLYAAWQTLQDMEGIFADRIWPNLASWKEEDDDFKLLYSTLDQNKSYKAIYPNISVQCFPLNHGCNDSGAYESTAFFIRHDSSGREFLFFGDVEPDSLVKKPQTINVWHAAAPKIPGTLSTIFIECSWPSGRPNHLLFGHLSPEHLAEELEVLAREVVNVRQRGTDSRSQPARKKRRNNPALPETLYGSLDGLHVYVTHCKDNMDNASIRPNKVIVEQVKALVEAKGLGAVILAAEQGMRIEI